MAGRGPLPTGTAVRRNKPTIPTTKLPASGRTSPVPKPPALYEFGPKAADWWAWAWKTSQACGWDDGSLFVVARRAQLEDDLDALAHVDLDLAFLVGEEENEAMRHLSALIQRLKSLAGGQLAVMKEMRELDGKLGLTPKGLADLRWTIVDDDEKPKTGDTPVPTGGSRRGALTVVA